MGNVAGTAGSSEDITVQLIVLVVGVACAARVPTSDDLAALLIANPARVPSVDQFGD